MKSILRGTVVPFEYKYSHSVPWKMLTGTLEDSRKEDFIYGHVCVLPPEETADVAVAQLTSSTEAAQFVRQRLSQYFEKVSYYHPQIHSSNIPYSIGWYRLDTGDAPVFSDKNGKKKSSSKKPLSFAAIGSRSRETHTGSSSTAMSSSRTSEDTDDDESLKQLMAMFAKEEKLVEHCKKHFESQQSSPSSAGNEKKNQATTQSKQTLTKRKKNIQSTIQGVDTEGSEWIPSAPTDWTVSVSKQRGTSTITVKSKSL